MHGTGHLGHRGLKNMKTWPGFGGGKNQTQTDFSDRKNHGTIPSKHSALINPRAERIKASKLPMSPPVRPSLLSKPAQRITPHHRCWCHHCHPASTNLVSGSEKERNLAGLPLAGRVHWEKCQRHNLSASAPLLTSKGKYVTCEGF